MIRQCSKFRVNRRGQNTVEYLILIAAVITVFALFLRPDGEFEHALNDTHNMTMNYLEGSTTTIWQNLVN